MLSVRNTPGELDPTAHLKNRFRLLLAAYRLYKKKILPIYRISQMGKHQLSQRCDEQSPVNDLQDRVQLNSGLHPIEGITHPLVKPDPNSKILNSKKINEGRLS